MSTDEPIKPDETQEAQGSSPPEEQNELFETAPVEEAKKPSRIRRGWGWLKRNRVRVGIGVLILGLALLSGITLSWLSAKQSNERQIQQAMDALESGNLIKARKVAAKVALDPKGTGRGAADAAFILGMVAADDAAADWPDSKSSYALAARYFDIAYPSGFPKNFQFLGLKTYGKALLECNRFAKSRQVLERALKIAKSAVEKNSVYYLLVENDLEAENPDLTEATRQNRSYLKSKELSDPQRIRGNLQQLQLQSRQGKFKAARETLALLPKTPAYSSKVYYAKGRLAMREAEVDLAESSKVSGQIRAKLDEAIESFRRAQGHADESSPVVPKAQYLIGCCFEMLGENRAAARQWKQVGQFSPDSQEAVASQYRLSELYFAEDAAEKGDGVETPTEEEPAEAIEYLGKVAKALAKNENDNDNPWVNGEEVRESATNRIEVFRKAGKIKAALGVAQAIAPLISESKSLRLLATLNRELGQRMLGEFEPNVGGEEPVRKRKQARKYFREASLLYTILASQGKTSSRYSEDLWRSADCALKGCDYKGAVKAFIKYLNTEPEKYNSAALLGLGESYLSLGQIDEAIDTFEQCIEFFPSDVSTFRARLLAAEAWREKGDPKPAEQLLLENWAAAGITPKSFVWRETLYRLGALYHDTKRYDKAIERLSDAVRRFPDDPRSNLARYLLADSYRLRANTAQERIEKTMTRSKLTAQKANIEADLNAAYRQYMLLQQKIGNQRGAAEISELDQKLLRNSRMFAAGVLFQLQQYKQAIKAYSTVSLHYLGHPISVQAMKQKAEAMAGLGQNDRAQILVRRTLSQVEKMGPDRPFEETTLYSYAEWIAVLEQMRKELAMKQQAAAIGNRR